MHFEDVPRPSFVFDTNLGMQIGVSRCLLIVPEIGYTHDTIGAGNFFTAGGGPSIGNALVSIGWAPKLVLGTVGDEFAIGVRNSLVGSFILNFVSVDIGHQWVRTGDANLHQIRFLFAIDALAVLRIAMAAAGAR